MGSRACSRSHPLIQVSLAFNLNSITSNDHFRDMLRDEVLDRAACLGSAGGGDRDGLPNVIPEAMAAGVLVITSPIAATTEAIQHEITGLIADVEDPVAWVEAFKRLRDDGELAERIRKAARHWAEENFDAPKNARRVLELMEKVARR